jgi:hypothetical protein
MSVTRNPERRSIVSQGMQTTTAERRGTHDDGQVIRLDPGAWWGLVVAALLVLIFVVAPIVVLAMGDDLDHEVTTVPGAPVAKPTQAPAPPSP